MVQELLPLLPKELGNIALGVAIVGTLIGAGLWLAGSRISRSLVTLVLVSAGGWGGMFLPRWCHWSIDGWAPALGGAIIAGIAGFFVHRLWVAVGLGLVLAAWAAVVTWTLCKGNGVWSLPKFEVTTQFSVYAHDLWLSVPDQVRKILPFACGAAALSGVLAALLWPKLGIVFLYSSAGVSMVVVMGLFAINMARPQWIGLLPARTSSQVTTVLAMVAFGALLQWRIAPSKAGPKERRPLVIHD